MIERDRGAAWEAGKTTPADAGEGPAVGPGEAAPAPVPDDEEARHARFMEIAREVMHRHRNVLAALAK